MKAWYVALAGLLLLGGALWFGHFEPDPSEKYHPRPRSGTFSFDVYVDDGTIHLVLADYGSGSKTPRLLHRRSDDGGESWSEPMRIDGKATPAYVPYRGIDPQIAAFQDELVVIWTTAGDDVFGYGTGPLATAVSSDGGSSWHPGPDPSDDNLMTAHEFIDMAAGADGGFHLVWIDDRDETEGIRRGLRYARSSDSGAHWSANTTIDEHICGCCWTHLRTDGDDLYLLYRDEHPAPSDMRLAFSSDSGNDWEERSVVGQFDWMLQGCPHTTGGLAQTESSLHAVVQTGKEGEAGIYHLVSENKGRDWSDLHRLVGEEGHYADLAASSDDVAVVWQEQRATRTVIVGAQSHDAGKSWSSPSILSDTDASASYPRVVATGDGFRALWTESDDGRKHTWTSVALN